jgi:hypothetical protein
MIWKDQCGTAAKECLNSRLKAICDWAGKETGASYSFLLLYDRETSQLYNTAWYEGQTWRGQDGVTQ